MEKLHSETAKLNPSLKQMTLRKIAVILWSQADIKHIKCFVRCGSYRRTGKWYCRVKKQLDEKVTKLLLTDELKEELLYVIKPIGYEIVKWRKHCEAIMHINYFPTDILDQLCWTSAGTIDYRKTAKNLIKHDRIDFHCSYTLACTYCLEEYARFLWGKFGDDQREGFFNERDYLLSTQPELVILWTCLISGRVAMLDGLINRSTDEGEQRQRSLYQYAFECAALSGNKAATEYFFPKLDAEDRDASLVLTAQLVIDKRCSNENTFNCDFPKQNFCGVLIYLLSEMSEEEKMQVFKKDPCKTLRCFMDWPWEDLFMKVAKLLWGFLSVDEYYSVLDILALEEYVTEYNYPKLFQEFYLQAPSHYRNYILHKHLECKSSFHLLSFSVEKAELIKFILRNADVNDREKFILCHAGYSLCWYLIERSKWDVLDMLITECGLSSEAKTILKSNCMNYIQNAHNVYASGSVVLDGNKIEWRKRQFKRFSQLIDNANVNDDNKKIIEEVEKEEEFEFRKLQYKKYSRLKDNANVNDDNKKIIEEVEKEEELKKGKTQKRRRKC